MTFATVEEAGKHVIQIASEYWAQGIIDPKRGDMSELGVYGRNMVQFYISRGLSWSDVYEGDGSFEWCGAFAAYCWSAAGLKVDWRKDFWASTYRLNNFGSYKPLIFPKRKVPNPKPATVGGDWRLYMDLNDVGTDPVRRDTLFKPFPGDVLLVGDKRGYGTHITLVESFDALTGVFKTISGNGVGTLGRKLGRGQGVVKKSYTLGKGPRVLIRPALSDLGE